MLLIVYMLSSVYIEKAAIKNGPVATKEVSEKSGLPSIIEKSKCKAYTISSFK